MDSLQSRADLKNRLRLNQTTIQPGDNNPLKFSASVDEAVRKLLDGHNTRYLGPIEAIRESFNDLKNHQSSMSTAMQSAVDTLLERLEPTDLQERFDRGLKRGSLLGAANKMKYWDLYAEFYQVLNQRDDAGLPSVFSEEFSRAYAEHAADPKPGRRRG
jgi:type VI secretion system protein